LIIFNIYYVAVFVGIAALVVNAKISAIVLIVTMSVAVAVNVVIVVIAV
jgi:hypothetical protein